MVGGHCTPRGEATWIRTSICASREMTSWCPSGEPSCTQPLVITAGPSRHADRANGVGGNSMVQASMPTRMLETCSMRDQLTCIGSRRQQTRLHLNQ